MSSTTVPFDDRVLGGFGKATGARASEGRLEARWAAAKAGLLRFLDRLPDGHEDIDPATLRRLPVPY